jgi:competence CoiA-like predicted nuclease
MGRGKEILLQEDDKFLIKIGTVDNKDPKSIFLTISSWTRPKREEQNYERIISNLRKKIKQRIFEDGEDNVFDPYRTIVDLDLRSSGISTSKKSFMFCEITMFQGESKLPIKSESILSYFKYISNNLIKDVFNENSIFEFNKTKNDR